MQDRPLGRKSTITWQELQKILAEAGLLHHNEEVNQVTLTKPRTILIYSIDKEK